MTLLLAMAGFPEDKPNPFCASGVDATASGVQMKEYRQLAVMVNPDKNHQPGLRRPSRFCGKLGT